MSHTSRVMSERDSRTDLELFVARREAETRAAFEEWATANAPAWAEEKGRTFNAADRRKAAKEGAALPDGSYPIYNQADLDNAARLVGSGDASADRVEEHIKKRAKQLGLKLPASISGS